MPPSSGWARRRSRPGAMWTARPGRSHGRLGVESRRPEGSVRRVSEDSVSFLSSSLQSEFLQESSLVLAKLHYVEGDYEGALSLYARAGLEDWPLTGVPPYRLRMAAEAYATQGEAARVPRAEPRLSLPGGSSWRPRCDPRPWASSPAAPGEAAGVAPRQAQGHAKPCDVVFPQNCSSSVGLAGEEFQSSFLIIYLRLKQGPFLVAQLVKNPPAMQET